MRYWISWSSWMEAGGNNDDFEFLKPLCSPPKTAVQHPRLSLILSDVRDHKQIEVRLGCFVLAIPLSTIRLVQRPSSRAFM